MSPSVSDWSYVVPSAVLPSFSVDNVLYVIGGVFDFHSTSVGLT